MKKIEAIIRPEQLESLKNALLKANVRGMTMHEVSGFGNQHGFVEHIRGSEVLLNTLPKIEIKLVVKDSQLPHILEIITSTLHTGSVGDGKIWISEITNCIRIRTGEQGEAAL